MWTKNKKSWNIRSHTGTDVCGTMNILRVIRRYVKWTSSVIAHAPSSVVICGLVTPVTVCRRIFEDDPSIEKKTNFCPTVKMIFYREQINTNEKPLYCMLPNFFKISIARKKENLHVVIKNGKNIQIYFAKYNIYNNWMN